MRYASYAAKVDAALCNWIDWVQEHHGLEDRWAAREIVLKKMEAKDGKVRKTSRIDLKDGKFVARTFMAATPGTEPLYIDGEPHVRSTPGGVKIGCVRFSNEAIFEIMRIMVQQLKSPVPLVHQVGNYGDPE